MTKPINRFSGAHDFLSNFYPSPVKLDGEEYPTVEHAFQAAKTNDPQDRKRIREAKTPALAKSLGRRVKLREDWEAVKVEVMTDLVRQKFSARDWDLVSKLLDTRDAQLVEGNNWGDRFWGVVNGEGRNELGRILMKVRREIQRERARRFCWGPGDVTWIVPPGPNCPKCHSRKLLKIVYGLPAQPPAEGTVLGGCEPRPETHACLECGHRFQRKKKK